LADIPLRSPTTPQLRKTGSTLSASGGGAVQKGKHGGKIIKREKVITHKE